MTADIGELFRPDDQPDDTGDTASDDVFRGDETPPKDTYGAADGDSDDREKAPRQIGKRSSAADLITLAWGGVGTWLVQSQTDYPVGRVLQFQAPLAGTKIDELIAGTWLDRFLQPLVKHGDNLEGLGALILFPLMVGAYERNPAIAPVAETVLRQVIRTTLVEMAPVLKKRQAEERRAAKAVGELTDLFDIPKGADVVDEVLRSIFAPPPGAEPETADPDGGM